MKSKEIKWKTMEIGSLARYSDETKQDDITVWGYRNVWFRFEPFEVTTIVPVSLQTISTLNNMLLGVYNVHYI